MIKDLNVTIVQAALLWEDVEANLALFSKQIHELEPGTDLVVIPEMFTTGFTMNAAPHAQRMDGSAVEWLRKTSEKIGADMVGSIIIQDDGHYYNRLVWATPEGGLHVYDKRHLFRMAGEEKVYRPGNRRITVELHGWKIRPFICYDLRFPGWTRNIANEYDIAVFIANWPESRSSHWKILLQARAIENQCYVVGVNRIGVDGNGLKYSGDSLVIDPSGNLLLQKSQEPCTQTISISYSRLSRYRAAFPVWMDADEGP